MSDAPAIGSSRTRARGAVLDLERRPRVARAAAGTRDQLDLQVELVALLEHALDVAPLQADEAAYVVLHPLFLLAPRSMTTQSLVRAADVSIRPSIPLLQQDPSFSPAPTGRLSAHDACVFGHAHGGQDRAA
jgi:hypothetical protein